MQESKNMLTTKESVLIADAMALEALASKKARLFSRTLTDEKLVHQLKKLGDNHERRFLALFELL